MAQSVSQSSPGGNQPWRRLTPPKLPRELISLPPAGRLVYAEIPRFSSSTRISPGCGFFRFILRCVYSFNSGNSGPAEPFWSA
jgi:hypothetical protein